MTDALFRLVFKGEIDETEAPEKVYSAVGRLLQCDEKKLERLFSGRSVILKDQLDQKTAEKYLTLFNQTGAICHIRRILPETNDTAAEAGATESSPHVADISCPKCGQIQSEAASCVSCGIFFDKFWQRQAELSTHQESAPGVQNEVLSELGVVADDVAPITTFRDSPAAFVHALILPDATPVNPVILGLKVLLLLTLTVWGGRFVFASISSNFAGESLLHLINLPFHEAGHVFFRPLGRFMTSAGGSITQIFVPLICLGVLLIQTRDAFGAAICLWWTGQNFLDLAPYINDARAGVMPLIGGNTGQTSPYGFHDWEFLLTETGLLRFDHLLARIAHVSGSLIMLLGLIWAGLILYRQYRAGQKRGEAANA